MFTPVILSGFLQKQNAVEEPHYFPVDPRRKIRGASTSLSMTNREGR
jgi:hypothetical protein